MFSSENLVIKDRFIRRWVHKEGFSGFKRYVTAAEDKELEAKIAVVEKYNTRIPDLVRRIERCHIEDLDFAGEEDRGSSPPGGRAVRRSSSWVSGGPSGALWHPRLRAWGTGSRAGALPYAPSVLSWGLLRVGLRASGSGLPWLCPFACRLQGWASPRQLWNMIPR